MGALTTGAVLASTVSNIGYVIVVLTLLGMGLYIVLTIRSGRDEVGSEIELAPNRMVHHPDEVLEGPVLNRNLALGLGVVVAISVGLPLYWLGEPGRNEGWEQTFEDVAVSRGEEMFAPSADGGLGCADCHGGMEATGGAAPFTINDANGDFVATVDWQAPALDTVLLRYSEEELFDILVYGRPFSPMPAWGLDGGGALNDQQVDNLIAYIREIQIEPSEAQAQVTEQLDAALEDDPDLDVGEFLFNLGFDDGFAGGAYSCGRCHTQGWSYGEAEADGTGAFGPNLTRVRNQFPGGAAGFEEHVEFVSVGSDEGQPYGVQGQGSGRMPGFGQMLTAEQIRAVVEYERNLGS